jgi:hypothetical protein
MQISRKHPAALRITVIIGKNGETPREREDDPDLCMNSVKGKMAYADTIDALSHDSGSVTPVDFNNCHRHRVISLLNVRNHQWRYVTGGATRRLYYK